MNVLVRRALLCTAGMLLFATLPAVADEATAKTDPWKGKARADVIQLLGEPDKVKKRGRDGETLTYKLVRIDPAAGLSQPGLKIMAVPGVGVVGQVDNSAAGAGPMAIGPTEFDKEGRPSGGGLHSEDSVTGSYDPETGELVIGGTASGNPTVAGKIKVRFVLDGDNRVKTWSVTGKK